MPEFTITIQHEAGLHARPLSAFVKKASQFEADIEVSNVTNGKGPSNGKSPLKLLLLAAQQGHEVKVSAEGQQAEEALAALKSLIENDFEE
ncbi:MAG: HPr family phosphocarrier protein [Chloroflexi bacterium]|nr:MAG: HPr family phosphocarrier protein [Chloroflexota bacterium]MBL1195484.1 HPr family phosphocarrier protein [Chloroflexota bacterium]NOH12766.1 HPr family phosphocarrier protein [Chloroflexota bacterium]